MYILLVAIELRKFLSMETVSAQRLIDLARNRRKELCFILGINKWRGAVEKRGENYTDRPKRNTNKCRYIQIGEYAFERIMLEVLMGLSHLRYYLVTRESIYLLYLLWLKLILIIDYLYGLKIIKEIAVKSRGHYRQSRFWGKGERVD